jgi:hypothetical protein
MPPRGPRSSPEAFNYELIFNEKETTVLTAVEDAIEGGSSERSADFSTTAKASVGDATKRSAARLLVDSWSSKHSMDTYEKEICGRGRAAATEARTATIVKRMLLMSNLNE